MQRDDRPNETWSARRTPMGEGAEVARALPARPRRSIGPWCFLDHFGPVSIARTGGMKVGPHPHIGLQTVTWLFEGAVLHRDSLGSVQRIAPGELNLMTAGEHGIVHAEDSAPDAPDTLHGVQLWIALPRRDEPIAPAFEHHAELPSHSTDGATTCVFVGSLGDLRSPATTWSPCVGAEIRIEAGARWSAAIDPAHEHGVFVVSGDVDGIEAGGSDTLAWFAPGRSRLGFAARSDTRLVLVGGAPRVEPLHMWWNYVAHDRVTIRRAARDWLDADPRFGEVPGHPGPRVEGPALPDAY